MATTYENTSFRCKAGTVKNTANQTPEKGAILFSLEADALVAADGFNWLPLTVGAPVIRQAIALKSTGIIGSMVAGVPQTLPVWDNIVYHLGDKIDLDIPLQKITLAEDMNTNWHYSYSIRAGAPSTTITSIVQVNGITRSTRQMFLQRALAAYLVTNTGNFRADAGDEITWLIAADKNTVITINNYEMGLQNVI